VKRMKKLPKILILILVIAAFSFLPAYAGAAMTGSQLLVDAQWLSGMPKVVIVDVRDSGAYLKGHIPGAINMDVNDLQTKPDAIMYPVHQCEKILGEKGLDVNKEVVLYGAGKEMAYLEFWMLDCMGMKDIHVLDGGIEQWKGQVSTVETKLPSVVFIAKHNPNKYATAAYVRKALRNHNIILLDVRTPGEYTGTDVRSLRGGHIPGAINMNFEENFQDDSTNLKSMDELAELYAKLDKKKEIVVYCQTGTRAANSYFVLRELGFPKVRNYDASWIEWGSNLSLPADDVSYFNFVSVLKSIKKLQKEVTDIEKKQVTGGK
jgi:thiosulfate/3-mercaptopyruvate sulfurtransferase